MKFEIGQANMAEHEYCVIERLLTRLFKFQSVPCSEILSRVTNVSKVHENRDFCKTECGKLFLSCFESHADPNPWDQGENMANVSTHLS